MNLYDIITDVCNSALSTQLKDGSFPPGINGPYKDTETPVRNTAHFVIAMLKAYEITIKQKFLDSAYLAAEYLISANARPMEGSFFCRKNPEKDFCNGLIGQAWVNEALSTATKYLGEKKYINLATEVFLLHPFSMEIGLWRKLAVDGSYLKYDMTFNHQLWFAASGSIINSIEPNEDILKRVKTFLKIALNYSFKMSKDGRIKHQINRRFNSSFFISFLFPMINGLAGIRNVRKMVKKEMGYQGFNLYGFSLLKETYPNFAIFSTKKLLSAVKYTKKKSFIKYLDDNKYAYPYNPSGFEIAYTLQTFSDAFPSYAEEISWWLQQQIERTYDINTNRFQNNTNDPNTLNARIYEAARLKNYSLNTSF